MTEPRITTLDIADMIGCTRRHATARVVTRHDFPKPVVNLSQKTRLWRRAEVEAYLKKGRR